MSVLLKQSFRLAPGADPEPIEEGIPFHEDGGDFETDLVAYKPLVDVVLAGRVHVPRGRPARFLDAQVRVGGGAHVVRVFGRRVARAKGRTVIFTDPEPFESAPIDVTHAYGGLDVWTLPQPATFVPNPHGRGFLLEGGDPDMLEVELPLLEDPQRPLRPETLLQGRVPDWRKSPVPAWFGPCPRDAWPRAAMAGMSPEQATDFEVQRRKRMQAMPEIGTAPGSLPPGSPPLLNPEFFQVAAPGLRVPGLVGGELCTLVYFHPDHPSWEFRLPTAEHRAWIGSGKDYTSMPMFVQTVEIRPDEGLLAMTWRGSAYFAGVGALADFEALEFGVEGMP